MPSYPNHEREAYPRSVPPKPSSALMIPADHPVKSSSVNVRSFD
jgi:hypothetical protein